MDKQEVFDKVARHLLTQNSRALFDPDNELSGCAYRAEGGKSCAVGCLIPDDLYDEKMENVPAGRLAVEFPKLRKLFNFDNSSIFLSLLQSIHDSRDVRSWFYELFTFAQKHNLDNSILKEFEG